MHEYNHFILGNRLLRRYNTIAMRPWCIHFGRERNTKENENIMVKMQQAAAKDIISSSTCFFFFEEPADKKKQKIGRKNWKNYYRCTRYTYHIQGRFGQPRPNWRRGRLQKAATTRDKCVVHLCASSVLSRRATSTAPAQCKNCRYFST